MPSQVGKMDVAKRNVKLSQTYCQKQRTVRCNVLEPVLEHCEAPTEIFPCRSAPQHSCNSQSGKKGKPMRILLKLRDGYVKLMNDLSSGAGLSGVSSFYGCPGTDVYAFLTMANSRLLKEEQEREIMMQALQVQLAHSGQFTTAMA